LNPEINLVGGNPWATLCAPNIPQRILLGSEGRMNFCGPQCTRLTSFSCAVLATISSATNARGVEECHIVYYILSLNTNIWNQPVARTRCTARKYNVAIGQAQHGSIGQGDVSLATAFTPRSNSDQSRKATLLQDTCKDFCGTGCAGPHPKVERFRPKLASCWRYVMLYTAVPITRASKSFSLGDKESRTIEPLEQIAARTVTQVNNNGFLRHYLLFQRNG